MKTKVYLRIGREGLKIKVDAHVKPNIEPLRIGTGKWSKAMPTVFMAIDLEIPDAAFKPPNIFASISVPIEKVGIAVEVVDPMTMVG